MGTCVRGNLYSIKMFVYLFGVRIKLLAEDITAEANQYLGGGGGAPAPGGGGIGLPGGGGGIGLPGGGGAMP